LLAEPSQIHWGACSDPSDFVAAFEGWKQIIKRTVRVRRNRWSGGTLVDYIRARCTGKWLGREKGEKKVVV